MSDYLDEIMYDEVRNCLERKIPKWFDKDDSRLLIKALHEAGSEILENSIQIFEQYLSLQVGGHAKDFFEKTADMEDTSNVKESLRESLADLRYEAEEEAEEEEEKERERSEKIKEFLRNELCFAGHSDNDIESTAKDLSKMLK